MERMFVWHDICWFQTYYCKRYENNVRSIPYKDKLQRCDRGEWMGVETLIGMEMGRGPERSIPKALGNM